jgi:regulatory protein
MTTDHSTPRKILDPASALVKARASCAYQERCHQEMRDKLYEWGLHRKEVEEIISRLISEGFLNEERFARAFAGGKFRIKQWGKVKIRQELKLRKISEYSIRRGMEEISEKEYLKTLQSLLEKKRKTIRDNNELIVNRKLAAYAASKGYEPELVWEVLRK